MNQLACMNKKCRDPCPGSCGANTECRVVNHTPNCVCLAGYEGDPFTQCVMKSTNLIHLASFYYLFSLIIDSCNGIIFYL